MQQGVPAGTAGTLLADANSQGMTYAQDGYGGYNDGQGGMNQMCAVLPPAPAAPRDLSERACGRTRLTARLIALLQVRTQPHDVSGPGR